MHGGAAVSGAPTGNQSALKHGIYAREVMDERRRLQMHMANVPKTPEALNQRRLEGALRYTGELRFRQSHCGGEHVTDRDAD